MLSISKVGPSVSLSHLSFSKYNQFLKLDFSLNKNGILPLKTLYNTCLLTLNQIIPQ